jgi:hypothetical protein
MILDMELRSDSHAAHAMRLRQVTGMPLAHCFEFLATLCAEDRKRYVEYFEVDGGSLLVDPVELEPTKAAFISKVKQEAKVLSGAGEFGRGMGRGGRVHLWVKDELLKRHGIVWRTAAEMNPHVALD